MNKKTWFIIFIGVLAGLNLAAIRKAEDPIRDTQTNPILYEQKMEEEKDGKKGPLLYSVKNNPRGTFFVEPPFEAVSKPSPGKSTPKKAAEFDETSGWWEEQPGEFDAPSSEGAPQGTLWDPSGEVPGAQDSEGAHAASDDDYWW